LSFLATLVWLIFSTWLISFIYLFIERKKNDWSTLIFVLGVLDINERTILVNWYNSLTSTGTLNWNISKDLCGQTGVYCDSSNPQQVYKLYFLFFFFLFPSFWNKWMTNVLRVATSQPKMLKEKFQHSLLVYQNYNFCNFKYFRFLIFFFNSIEIFIKKKKKLDIWIRIQNFLEQFQQSLEI